MTETEWCPHHYPVGSPCDKCEIDRLRGSLQEIVECPRDSAGQDDSKQIARDALDPSKFMDTK